MRCRPREIAIVLLCVATVLPGCAPQQPFYLRNNADLSHYVGLAATIDNAVVPEPRNSEVEGTIAPFSIARSAPTVKWELTLEQTMKIALQNGKVMRSIGGQVQGPPAFLTSNPNGAPTIYDPAIVETDARFGIAAGESLFDPTWTTNFFWERNHDPRDVAQNLAGSLPLELSQDVFQFQTAMTKTTAAGAALTLSQSTSYDMERNDPTRQNASDWQTSFQMELRQPLLQGAGVEYNEIAGPGAIPGFNQGVLIARVNTDIALTSFEGSVRNMVSDVESTYWELYFAYRNLDAAVQGRDAALRTWQSANANYIAGIKDAGAAVEAQAREQYFVFQSTAEQAQLQLYETESRLRFLMGIAATDGRLILPIDDPTTAKITFDWADVQCEAMARSVEIREARWRVKQRDLELIAAKNYLLPRVDLDGRYSWQGQGPSLINHGDSSSVTGGAFDNLGAGQYQSWHVGVEASVPIGFRKQTSGVTSAEMAVSRDQVKLRETELEVSHQVAFAVRDMEANYMLTLSNFNRRMAAERNVTAVQAAFTNGDQRVGIDVVLQAQRSLAQAESDYFRSLTNYAKSISQVHFRKGSLLEYNGVYLTEGPWPAKAYFDARRRARARANATYIDYGYTFPKHISRGPNQQFYGQPMGAEETPAPGASRPGQPDGKQPELMPTPAPSPSGPRFEPVQIPLPAPSAAGELTLPASTAEPMPAEHGSHDIGALNLSALGSMPRTVPAAGAGADLSGAAPAPPQRIVQPAAFQSFIPQ